MGKIKFKKSKFSVLKAFSKSIATKIPDHPIRFKQPTISYIDLTASKMDLPLINTF